MSQVQQTQGQVVQTQVQEQPAQTQVVQAIDAGQQVDQGQPVQEQVVVQAVPVVNNSPKKMFKNVVRSLTPVVQRGVPRIRAIPENMKQQLVNQINQSVVNYLKNTKFELCTTSNDPVTQQGGGRRNYKKYNLTKKHRKSKKHKSKKHKSTKHTKPKKHTKKRTRKRKY
jgi:hypothetical protein